MNSEARAAGAAAAAAQLTATAPGEVDGWAPPMAADALLIRGRLALLDGKLRVGGVSIESRPPTHPSDRSALGCFIWR